MTEVTLTFPEPVNPNGVDGSQLYILGQPFTVARSGSWIGNEWRVPNTVEPGVNHYAIGFVDAAPAVPTESKLITPTPGGLEQFLFDDPIPVEPANGYTACFLTLYFSITNPYSYPQTENGLTGLACKFRPTSADTGVFPDSDSPASYHISPIVVFPDSQGSGVTAVVIGASGTGRVIARGAGVSELVIALAGTPTITDVDPGTLTPGDVGRSTLTPSTLAGPSLVPG